MLHEVILLPTVLVAEVTYSSFGVGYEIGWAHTKGINVLCLYRIQPDRGEALHTAESLCKATVMVIVVLLFIGVSILSNLRLVAICTQV